MTILSLLVVAVTFGQSLAHPLEFPGKRRLDEATYQAVQQIYYPGFTLGGFTEPVGVVTLAVLLYLTPSAARRFVWIAAALLFLASAHAVYWLVTHPVNEVWVEGLQMSGAGASFFSTASTSRHANRWTALRDRWEWSHVARAVLTAASLACLACAATLFESGNA